MSMIEVKRDIKNPLLSRREITCNFNGLAGRLKKIEAIDMISKHFNLEGKTIVPIILKNETGRPVVSGIFYVYDDEKIAREHLKTAVFSRLDKAKAAATKSESAAPDSSAEQPEKPKEESK